MQWYDIEYLDTKVRVLEWSTKKWSDCIFEFKFFVSSPKNAFTQYTGFPKMPLLEELQQEARYILETTYNYLQSGFCERLNKQGVLRWVSITKKEKRLLNLIKEVINVKAIKHQNKF